MTLTEEIVQAFEAEDARREQEIGEWWETYHRLRREKNELHAAFRKEHGLPLQSVFQSIADWRWQQKEKR